MYKTGFATTQSAYEKAVNPLFESLDRLEKMLRGKDYLIGDQLTEADIRLFVTIVRFDPVYVGHFKCNIRTIRDGYPAIHLWLRKLYWKIPAFKDTCNFEHIKTHYYWSHTTVSIPVAMHVNRTEQHCRSTHIGLSQSDQSLISYPSMIDRFACLCT